MVVIKIENLWKQYRLGVIGHGTLQADLQSWWARKWGKEDPNAKITAMYKGQEQQVEGDRFWALRDINLEVQQGEILGIIGKNGAGKSTLLKILSRVTAPTRGEVKVKGRIASLLEVGTGFHPELTGRENIFLNGAILGMTKAEIKSKFDEIVDFSGVEQFIDTPVKRYSSGMYVRLAFAVAAHLDPEILVVDEVLAVGDAEFQKKCLGKMGNISKQGRTILFVSHNMNAIKGLCGRAVLLEECQVRLEADVNKCVGHYLNRNLVQGAVADKDLIAKRMEGVIQKGNPHIRFHQIALLDSQRKPRKSFNSDEDIVVSVTFECVMPVPSLFILMNVCDENATPILNSQNLDDQMVARKSRNVQPGVYSAQCVLPKNSFGQREFYLSIHLISEKTEHLIVEKILSFDVTFKSYDQSYSAPNVFFRPRLQWVLQEMQGVRDSC